jgi:hypothetical protein
MVEENIEVRHTGRGKEKGERRKEKGERGKG